jgi:hypothetical protein
MPQKSEFHVIEFLREVRDKQATMLEGKATPRSSRSSRLSSKRKRVNLLLTSRVSRHARRADSDARLSAGRLRLVPGAATTVLYVMRSNKEFEQMAASVLAAPSSLRSSAVCSNCGVRPKGGASPMTFLSSARVGPLWSTIRVEQLSSEV